MTTALASATRLRGVAPGPAHDTQRRGGDRPDGASPRRRAPPAAWRPLRWLLALLVGAVLAGCASLPPQVQRTPTQAQPGTTATTLGRIANDSLPEVELTGFRLLPTGAFAIDTRLTLLQRAERSIDIQYYLVQDDATGRTLLRALRDAALRGVRVRLLLDDLYTAGSDPLLLGLAAFDNVELRLFNPFPGGRGGFVSRFVASAADFSRVNRRMHNKLLVVDGAMAIAGGRNIADEYFMRHALANFVDLDTFMIGALVPRLQQLFDDYWNSPVVYPLHAIVPPVLTPEEHRAWFDAYTGPAQTLPEEPLPSVDVLGYGPLREDLDAGRVGLVWAEASAYADPPARIKGMGARYGLVVLEDVESVRHSVAEMVRGARREVLLTSPYLVPGERGMALFAGLRSRGVTVKLLTNSLAATDEPLVHLGYRKYRPQLLRLGVDVYELSPLRVQRTPRLGRFASTQGRLHAKTVVVDRRKVFIGSMNFDPRSEKFNTEMGVFVDSPALAREVLRLMDLDKLQASFRVVLGPDGRGLRWLASDDEGEVVHDAEPEVGLGTKLWLELLSPLAPEELL